MTGREYEKLSRWQQLSPNRRVDVTLDYRQWEERFIERIMVLDGNLGMFWTTVTPEEIDRMDTVLLLRSVQVAREAIADNFAVLERLQDKGLADSDGRAILPGG